MNIDEAVDFIVNNSNKIRIKEHPEKIFLCIMMAVNEIQKDFEAEGMDINALEEFMCEINSAYETSQSISLLVEDMEQNKFIKNCDHDFTEEQFPNYCGSCGTSEAFL